MPQSPFYPYIQAYFPREQWEIADCIQVKECSPTREGYPDSCVAEEGLVDCGHGPVQARSWGIFQILDACWNPALNPDSPFSPQAWAQVMDPNVNTWMASVIWSRGGWGAWTTCSLCDACSIPGGAIPHPDGPLISPPPLVYIPPPGSRAPAVFGVGLILFAIALAT
jgi:hypothetical protein